MTPKCPLIEFKKKIEILIHINHEVIDMYIYSVIATKITDDVKALRENRLPVFMAWSRNDKMIEEKLSRDLLNTLGMPTENDVSGDHPGTIFLQR